MEKTSPSLRNFIKVGSKKPLVAAIEGFALAGGFEIALNCNLPVAAKGSRFGIPEVGVGFFAAGGSLMRLPIRVGYNRAMELALTGKPILAEEAATIGLVCRLVDKGCAFDSALSLAKTVSQNAPLAVLASKQLIQASQGLTEAQFWDLQRPLQSTIFSSHDAKEGSRAFKEKRAPVWSGR
jgi:enoyl-CoA hydratase